MHISGTDGLEEAFDRRNQERQNKRMAMLERENNRLGSALLYLVSQYKKGTVNIPLGAFEGWLTPSVSTKVNPETDELTLTVNHGSLFDVYPYRYGWNDG